MKLYATVTSDRASKGQGGNEYIEIVLKNEDKIDEYVIRWTPEALTVCGAHDNDYLLNIPQTKGEKQKGEQDEYDYGLCVCGNPANPKARCDNHS